MSDLRATVFALHALGLSVFPLKPRSKEPDTAALPEKSWKRYQDARATESDLTRWFGNGASRNAAVVMGNVSGVIVVESDTPDAEVWCAAHLPHTPMMTRSARGIHRYYRRPMVGKIPPFIKVSPDLQIEIKRDGQYVVAPGSVHPSGHVYAQVEPWPTRLDALPSLPTEFLMIDEPAPPASPTSISREERMQKARAWLSTQRAGYDTGYLPNDPVQCGDQTTYAVCCSVRQGFDLTEDDAFEVMRDWNARCEPVWPESELRAKLRNAARYATGTRGEKLADFPLTEAGDAEFFAAFYGDKVRFDHRRQRWLVFSGHRWKPDPDGELHRLGLETMRLRQQHALAIGDSALRAKHQMWAIKGESRSRIDNMLALARSIKPISDPGDDWDADPWLIGAPNGVLDLRSGVLRNGRPEDRITMSVRVPFDSHATCSLFEQTVSDIFNGDRDLISYHHRAFGYSLSGDCREECLFFCWGDGRNGKGTLMNTFAHVLGDYADDLPFSAIELHDRSGIPNDIAKLVGKRYATASESGETTRLNEARVKALTGRDPITARFMRAEFFTFQPVAKFWLAANKKPIVRDDSQGFWSRIHLIPFTRSFAGKENRALKDELRAEAPGILAWAVRGCLAWQAEGLNPPAVVRNATEEYRRESEPLNGFYDACCVTRDGAKVQAADLFRAYVRFCDDYFVERSSRLGSKQFAQEIRKRFKVDEKRVVSYLGIGLLTLGTDL